MSTKICSECNTKNDSGNLTCIKCSSSIIYAPIESDWTEENEKNGFKRNFFLEEFISSSFFIRIIIGFISTYLFCLTLNPFLLVITILVVGTFFIPKEKDYFSISELYSLFYKNFVEDKRK